MTLERYGVSKVDVAALPAFTYDSFTYERKLPTPTYRSNIIRHNHPTMTTSETTASTAEAPTLTNDTLRKRILIGGSQPLAAPPRGLAKAVSRFRELTAALQSDDTPKVEDASTALRSELALHDLEMRKLFLSARAYDAASSKSAASLSTMNSSQSTTQKDIESLTIELNHEKKIRRNREEYNTLAKMVNTSHPPAKKTREDLKSVQEEIAKTKEEVDRARWEISVRERQIRVLMTSLGDLREVLRDEEWRKKRGEATPEETDCADDTNESNAGNKSKRLSDSGSGDPGVL